MTEIIQALREKADQLETIATARLSEPVGSIQEALAAINAMSGDEEPHLKLEFRIRSGKLLCEYSAYVPKLRGATNGYQYSWSPDFKSLAALLADIRHKATPEQDEPSENTAELLVLAGPQPMDPNDPSIPL